MPEILAVYGIPSTIINTIALFYENSEAWIITPYDQTIL